MQQKEPLSVLLAPLDWGLGHATRCIPVIHQLIEQGVRVILASNGPQKVLLKQEFPLLEFLDLPGYSINYKPGFLLKWGLIFKIPGILKRIRAENVWLEQIRQRHRLHAVISDNRYGLFNEHLFCVFITHQLNIQSGLFRKSGGWIFDVGVFINRRIMKWNYKFISKFNECWIPDGESADSMAGILSHPPEIPVVPIKYLGALSRTERSGKSVVEKSLLILLSGPEPQRTAFENILLKQLKDCHLPTTLLRGLPDGDILKLSFAGESITILNHLSSASLNKIMNESEIIIARSGYSTIMDLVSLGKNAIIVPTPGQSEQEYLGHYMHEKKWMINIEQKKFDLKKSIIAFRKAGLQPPHKPESQLKKVIEDMIRKL